MKTFTFAAALLSGANAQQAGTLSPVESHPKLSVQECTSEGCTTEQRSIVLDANWRWVDIDAKNCYDGNEWTDLCAEETCTQNCSLEGASYDSTYGITTTNHNLTLGFVTSGTYGDNVGSRSYLMAEDDTNYEMFNLLNKEFTFDVDLSTLPCGLNAALYFVEMPEDGGLAAYDGNDAGATFGTGYCDAQCPHDVKYIEGEANVLDWVPFNANSGKGRYGACCTELDIWEANTVSNAFTPHVCENEGLLKCDGVECGDTDKGERYDGTCDKDGCDFASFRLGAHNFYGSSSAYTIDSSRPFTVITQFVTDDGTNTGNLVEMRRKYVQDGKVIENPSVEIGGETFDAVTDDFCAAQKTAFGDTNDFAVKGGMKAMGESMARGHVLVLSLWDDYDVNMLWLDSLYPTNATTTTPGAYRGTCATDSGDPTTVEATYPDSSVTWFNIRWGELNSTFDMSSSSAQLSPLSIA